MPLTAPMVAAIAGVIGAGTGIYAATQNAPKAQGQPQTPKDPAQNVYKDRNAQNALVQGGDSTGTGSLLSNPGNVANNLLGQ